MLNLKEIKNLRSEEEFERLVRKRTDDRHQGEWVIGIKRGKKFFELMKKFDCGTGSIVLDLGCGCGGISLSLSRHVKLVLGIEIDSHSVTVAHLRVKLSNNKNLFVIQGTATNIPIKGNSLDFVLISGVLEWVPYAQPHQNPELTQLEVLREAMRLLKKGGMLILAIENRYYLRYWLGLRDHHSGLRFVPILPRRVADFISRRVTGRPYLSRTYSYFELRSMVKRAGFADIKVLTGIPDYVFPEKIVEIDDKVMINDSIDRVRSRKSRKMTWKIINKANLMKIFSSNFILACTK